MPKTQCWLLLFGSWAFSRGTSQVRMSERRLLCARVFPITAIQALFVHRPSEQTLAQMGKGQMILSLIVSSLLQGGCPLGGIDVG